MFGRVRFRLTLLTLSIVVCLYVVSSIAVYAVVRGMVYQSIDRRMATVVATARTHDNVRWMDLLPADTYAFVVTRRGVVAKSNAPAGLQSDVAAYAGTRTLSSGWRAVWAPAPGQTLRLVAAPLQRADGKMLLVIGTNVEKEVAVLLRLRDVLWMVGGVGLLVAALAGFYLAERSLRPIRQAWQRQLEFVADASHELRTPLSVIQSNLGVVMEHTEQSVTDNLEWVHNAYSEARRMSKLVQDLLTLARSDTGTFTLEKETVDLSTLVTRVCELFQPVVTAKGQTLTCQVEPAIHTRGDADRLHQLLVILLDNASKFTPEGGRVEVRVEQLKSVAVLTVSDTGRGIHKRDLSRIFDRFYQVDTARSREKTKGSGLGLAIAKWVAEAHGGKIAASSRIGTGSQFTVQLPATTSHGRAAGGVSPTL